MKWFETLDSIIPKPEDLNKALFRIISFDSLLQMLNEKKNTLVLTSKWEDSYENFMLKQQFIRKGELFSLESMSNQLFGQCWTRRMSSDAMWRIYSPDKKSVRIKTTVGQLWNCVSKYLSHGKCIIGKVQYFPQSVIVEDLEKVSPIKVNDLVSLVISSFFVKRDSFSHESEYRVVYLCDKESEYYGKYSIQMDIDPLDFIKNVYFDPRADASYVDRCKLILNKGFSYPANRIHQSSLYDFAPRRIVIA